MQIKQLFLSNSNFDSLWNILMIQKIFFILEALFVLSLFFNSELISGELILKWNIIESTDQIYDIEFMPDHDYFITGGGKQIKIRRTDNGDSIKSFPFGALNIELTPDGRRVIIQPTYVKTGRLQLRNLEDLTLIKEIVLEEGPDTNGPNGWYTYFKEIIVDPIKPYLYAIWERGEVVSGGKVYYTIQKYDYEKMELVEDLTFENEQGIQFTHLSISKDGKYLAALNNGESRLIVWDLATKNRIVDFLLCRDLYKQYWRGEPSCLKFSEIDTKKIYIAGYFPQGDGLTSLPQYKYQGLLVFDIEKNAIIDSTFAISPLNIGSGQVEFSDDETKIFTNGGNYLRVINLETKKLESQIIDMNMSDSIIIAYMISSKNLNHIIGHGYQVINKLMFDSTLAGIEFEKKVVEVIYPNPSNGFVQIKSDCIYENCKCEIFGINGDKLIDIPIIFSNTGLISIDFGIAKSGIYYVVLSKNSKIETYKIVKE
mgnify:CR=1 FL=1